MRPWPQRHHGIAVFGILIAITCTPTPAAAQHPAKRTVILIPGIMGSALRDSNSSSLEWVNILSVVGTYPCSEFLLPLTLAPDGHSPMPQVTYTCSDSGWTTTAAGVPIRVDGPLSGGSSLTEWIPDVYAKLINSLNASYNVVPFGYDWRLDYEVIAQQLNDEIKKLTRDGSTVDIVAHSQGGLIARLYLAKFGSGHHVGKIIFLGTPQLGAPKSYAILSGWEAFDSYFGPAVLGLNFETGTFVSRTFPAIYELLPQFNFFTLGGQTEPFTTTFNHLSNHNLVTESNVVWQKLSSTPPPDVKLFAINGSGQNTLAALKQQSPNGCIVPVDDAKGDGTVPVNSATALPRAQQAFVRAEHSDLPNSEIVRESVVGLLKTGDMRSLKPDPRRSNQPFSADHIVATTCGPLRISVYDMAGHIVGAFRAMGLPIPDSQYFRFAAGGNDAVMLPVGRYVVVLNGTNEAEGSLAIQLFAANGERKLATSFAHLHVTKRFKATLLLDLSQPKHILQIDRNGTGKFAEQVTGNPEAAIF